MHFIMSCQPWDFVSRFFIALCISTTVRSLALKEYGQKYQRNGDMNCSNATWRYKINTYFAHAKHSNKKSIMWLCRLDMVQNMHSQGNWEEQITLDHGLKSRWRHQYLHWFLVPISAISTISAIVTLVSADIIGIISFWVPQNPIWCCYYISEWANIWNHALDRPYEYLDKPRDWFETAKFRELSRRPRHALSLNS